MSKNIISDDEDEIGVEEEAGEEEHSGNQVDDREEDEEEDEEGQDEYEKDGFIVDDVEDEEEEEEQVGSDDDRQKKKKRKKRESERNYVLDEDDYELLQESNISVPRPKLESQKFKRLKKARRDSEEEPSGLSDEEEFDGSGKGGRTAEEKLKRSLFGDDDGQPLEDIAEEDEQFEEEDADIGEEDEMADFIVDEEEVDEHGAPLREGQEEEELVVAEEEHVLLDLDDISDHIHIPPNAPYVLSGLDTANPILIIDNKIKLIGEYVETVGTCLVFNECDGGPIVHEEVGPSEANIFSGISIIDPNQTSTKQVNPVASLHKVLKFKLLLEAENEDKPSPLAAIQYSLRPVKLCTLSLFGCPIKLCTPHKW